MKTRFCLITAEVSRIKFEAYYLQIDLLHLLPFIYFTINYLPFYISPNDYKIAIITKTIQDKNYAIEKQLGLFSENIFFLFRPIQAIFYLIFQWGLIVRFNRDNPNKKIEEQIRLVLQWLKVFTTANSCILLAYFSTIGLYFFMEDLFEDKLINIVPNFLLGLSFFIICSYLLIYPQTLTGLPFVKYRETKSNLIENEVDKIPFIYEDYSQEINCLETYFKNNSTFLQPNLTISQVAVETHIPNRDLSYIINNYYEKRFSDFLNEMRLKHFLTKVDSNTLDSFTIEAIALESGFSSKSSFYRSFNRFYSCTPSEYLQSHQSAILKPKA